MSDAATPERSNLLTPSRMRTFRKCNRLHFYEYHLGYRPSRPGEALRFGSFWHNVVEAGLRAVQALCEHGADARSYETFQFVAIDSIPSDADPFDVAKVRCYVRAMRKVLEEECFFDKHEILTVEKPFMFPHVNPATLRASPLWLRAGKIDAIVRHRASGRIRVVEHKTTDDSIDMDSFYWQRLSLDTQISQYVVGTEAMYPGITVDEIVYDVLRKTGLRPLQATPPESRKFTQPKYRACAACKAKAPDAPHLMEIEPGRMARCEDGKVLVEPSRLYENHRLTDESPTEYEQRVEASISENVRGHYRIQIIPRTEAQIEDHLREVWALSQAMRVDQNENWAPKNPDACFSYGVCPFFGVCAGTDTLENPDRFVRLTDVHPEFSPEDVEEMKEMRNV